MTTKGNKSACQSYRILSCNNQPTTIGLQSVSYNVAQDQPSIEISLETLFDYGGFEDSCKGMTYQISQSQSQINPVSLADVKLTATHLVISSSTLSSFSFYLVASSP